MTDFQRWSSLLRPRSLTFFLQPVTIRGPRTFSGRSQIGAPDAGFWTAKMTFQIIDRLQLLEWRGMIADMEGGLVPYLIGPFDERQAPEIGGDPLDVFTTHGDGTPFSDGTLYSQPAVGVSLRDALPIGATETVFRLAAGGVLLRGQYFSIDGRMFIIRKPPEVLSENRVRVEFLPPARAPALADAHVEFEKPLALMQIADPKSGAVDLSGIYYGEPTIELEESFEGLA